MISSNYLRTYAEKFWGRIHLAISLVGRRSPLSLENKVILYKQILRPVITYGSLVWGAAATTHMKKIQSLSISKYMISILKAHCHPPINDRSIANASCTTIGPPPLKSRPSLQAQVSKTMKIKVPDRG
ncbi:hypothetical protein TNCV_3504931 [Trichonephila clavipes]|uniref:Uncharacterized protein n=1 Tax=Trichonephila clavipes TaxID=2585209 RepID=A0A8X6S8V3_TRICX|nr:hypothetical protein TNCV_3504931 [Trichonephila clavipes]